MLCHPSWSVGEWGACSRSCGGGEQTRPVQCVQRTSQTDVADLSDAQCVQPVLARRQACNTHSCPPVWVTGPWSQVSLYKNQLLCRCYLQQEANLLSSFAISPEPEWQWLHHPL